MTSGRIPRKPGRQEPLSAVLACLVSCLFLLLPTSPALSQRTHKSQIAPIDHKPRVLILHSYHYGFTWSDNLSSGIRSALADQADKTELLFEFMDTRRIHTNAYFLELLDVYRTKYGEKSVDLVICCDDYALTFITRFGRLMFYQVPIVFCSVSGYDPALCEGLKVTGLRENIAIGPTLDVALQLHPETEEVAVITDMTRTGQALKAKAEKVFDSYKPEIKFRYLEDLTVEELTDQVSALSEGTIVFLFIFSRDKAGRVFSHEENLKNLAKYCPVPIFAVWEFYLGHGIEGGRLTSGVAEGKAVGELALRILGGERASDIPLGTSPTQYMFDYRQMRRFGVKEFKLPPESIVINKQPSFFQKHEGIVWNLLWAVAILLFLVVLLAVNIASRRRTERALKESEEKFSTAFLDSPDIVVISRMKDGSIIDVNDQFEQTTGYDREEVMGKNGEEVNLWVVPEDREFFLKLLQDAGQVENLETQFRHKDGTMVSYLVSARPVEVHGEKCILSITRDISDRKRVEESLRESEERYRDLYENAPNAYFSVNYDDKSVTTCNAAAQDLLDYDKETMMTKRVFDLYADTPDGLVKAREVFKQFQAGEPVRDVELQMKKSDGTPVWVSLSVEAVRDSEGNIIATRSIAVDISERKRLEAQAQQAQKLESIGTLAGGIAHDFNNLLMGIQGNVSLMLLDVDSSHPHYKRLGSIEQQIQKGANLTSHLLGYARKGKYHVKPVNLNHLVDETVEIFGRTKREISVTKQLADDLFAVEADAGQIEQVLLNLFVNASDAMPTGGNLTIKTSNVSDKDLKDKHYRPKAGNYVRLTVTDTGAGMDKKTMERIFDPFFTTKEMGRGTGLGLASAYGIIKGHAGYIDVDSKLDEGTTFSIHLPASEKAVGSQVQQEDEVVKGSETILLVDDEETVREVGLEMLQSLGYQVETAKDGKEAIDLFRENHDRIDVVLLDLVMPNMGGGETYDRLKEIDPDVKVLLLSGYSVEGQASELLQLGCNGFIQKPFNMKELSGRIRAVLETA